MYNSILDFIKKDVTEIEKNYQGNSFIRKYDVF